MKYICFILCITLFACTLCSCSQLNIATNLSDNVSSTSSNTLLDSVTDSQTETEKNEPQTFTETFDGIIMTVKTNKTKYRLDEPIHVEASVENTTKEKIHLYVPCLGDSHTQIATNIYKNNERLIDVDTFMKHFDQAIDVVTINSGEKYIQNMTYETYTGTDKSSRKQAEEGIYSGKSSIRLLLDPTDFSNGNYIDYSLDFSLILGETSNSQTETIKNEPQTFTETFDDIVITVTTDKTRYIFDEIIKVTASVKNVGNKTLNLFVPTSSPNTHQEIYTTITHNGNFLCDPVTTEGFDEGTATVYIEPGEEYVQEMNYETYYFSYDSKKGCQRAEEGLYSGKCSISLRTDPNDSSESGFKDYSLDFSLILGSETEPRHELCENKPQTVTKDYNGIIMTVKTDKRRYEIDEPIYVEASVKNTTDKAIHLFVP